MSISRRQFLTLASAGAASTVVFSSLQYLYAEANSGRLPKTIGYGPLQKDPKGLLDLPKGFKYRTFSLTGQKMSDGNPVPGAHDGMAAFPGPNNTTILIRNHELLIDSPTKVIAPESQFYDPNCKGGTTTLIVGRDRKLIKHFTSLAGTYRNCSGGATPWGSWISCEENVSTPNNDPKVSKPHGYNFEVPVNAKSPVTPEPLIAMGRFMHEAIAVDPRSGIIYQTEDRADGLFYRFIPKQKGNLKAGGILEALKIKGQPQAITTSNFPVNQPMAVEWVRIEDVNPVQDNVRVEGFNKGAAQFSRGEGICFAKNELFFTCTNGGNKKFGQIWRYIPERNNIEGGTLELFVELGSQTLLNFPDNITMAANNHLMICEDGDPDQYICGVTPKGEIYRFAHNALNGKEFAGICFSPDNQTMFLNIYDPGITFAIWGPWARI